jgi:endonuclease G, mitochondrial
MKRLLFLPFIFLPFFVFGQCDLLPTSTTHEIVKHTYYTLSFSKKDEQAEWVAYLLTRSMITGKSERTENFRPDPAVPSGSAQLEDYKNSGFDRGHLCPAGDMTFSDQAMSETFYLSNMSPQVPAFNRGIWKSLETLVRGWAGEYDSIYIVSGGILKESKDTIGSDRVTVPSKYYKVIYALKGVKKMIAFILPNEKGTEPLQHYIVTVRDVESQTGIDFFHCLPDSTQNRLENNSDVSRWDFNITSTSSTGRAEQNYGAASSSNTTSGYRQCAAITKAGTRCKRPAMAGSDYCWQHQKR